jgi:hypothetical protein
MAGDIARVVGDVDVASMLPGRHQWLGAPTALMEHRCCSRDIDGASMSFAGNGKRPGGG